MKMSILELEYKNIRKISSLQIRFLYKGIIINHNKNRANLH